VVELPRGTETAEAPGSPGAMTEANSVGPQL